MRSLGPSTRAQGAGSRAPTAPKRALPSFPRQSQLDTPADLDALLTRADSGGVVAVCFGADFGVTDAHVIRLVEALGGQLLSLRLGSSDTGDGSRITDAAVQRIVALCPSLQVLDLDSCTLVTDKGFGAITQGLGELLVLSVTGNDRVSGRLTKGCIKPLAAGALPHLQRLGLTDQGVDMAPLERLCVKRRQLVVQVGDTGKWGGGVLDIKYYRGLEHDIF